MQNLFLSTNLISVIASILFLTYLGLLLPFINKANGLISFVVVLMLVLFILFVPIYHGFNLIEICRGVFVHLSFTTMIILLLYNLKRIFFKDLVPLNLRFAIFLFILGLLLYLSALDLVIKFDLYDLGYFPRELLLAFIVSEIFIYFMIGRLYAWIWLFALILFYFHLAPSHNLWDYLFDPLLWLFALSEIFKHFIFGHSQLDHKN